MDWTNGAFICAHCGKTIPGYNNKCNCKKTMTLYNQLLYNWERGFYSVVRRKGGDFLIVTTPLKQNHKDSYGDYEGMQYTYPCDSIEEAKKQVFDCECVLSRSNPCAMVAPEHWEIVDTIHPSELMGKGFQVGDKVIIPSRLGFEGKVVDIEDDNVGSPVYTVEFDDTSGCFFQQDLKPVLPVEEKKEECQCGVLIDKDSVGEVYCGNCGKHPKRVDLEAYKAIQLLKEKGIIKDGHVVNLS